MRNWKRTKIKHDVYTYLNAWQLMLFSVFVSDSTWIFWLRSRIVVVAVLRSMFHFVYVSACVARLCVFFLCRDTQATQNSSTHTERKKSLNFVRAIAVNKVFCLSFCLLDAYFCMLVNLQSNSISISRINKRHLNTEKTSYFFDLIGFFKRPTKNPKHFYCCAAPHQHNIHERQQH